MSNKNKRNKYIGKKDGQKKQIPQKPLYIFGIIAIVGIGAVLFIFSNQGKNFINSLFQTEKTVTTPVAVQKEKELIKSSRTENTNIKKEEQIIIADTTADKKIEEKELINPSRQSFSITLNKNELTQKGSYFSYTSSKNVEIKYFGLLDKNGQAHVAFDACDVCFRAKKGYAIQGDNAVCRNCGNRYPVSSIGTENQYGGCWPSYLPIEVNGDIINIKIDDLEAHEYMFS
ncbi:MAG: DUF2318 domain-containing protein [Spirochaetales bacterium]|nr:DUF2318 domain-containing protein [Spirochaetales bacterium]